MEIVFLNTDTLKCKFIDFEGINIRVVLWDDEVLYFNSTEISYIKLS